MHVAVAVIVVACCLLIFYLSLSIDLFCFFHTRYIDKSISFTFLIIWRKSGSERGEMGFIAEKLRQSCYGNRGNFEKSGFRFSRKAFFPSCPSSDM
jgi:hypothetical protein